MTVHTIHTGTISRLDALVDTIDDMFDKDSPSKLYKRLELAYCVQGKNMQFKLDGPCDHVTAVPTKDGRCAIMVFGGSNSRPQGKLQSIMQLPRPNDAANNHVRYVTATVEQSDTESTLNLAGSIRDFLGSEPMTASVLTERNIILPDKRRMPSDILTEEQLQAGADELLKLATSEYMNLVPAAEQKQERMEFQSNGRMWQMLERPCLSVITPYSKLLVSDKKQGKKGKVNVRMCTPGSVTIGATVVRGHMDRVKAGGENNTIAMQVVPHRCKIANNILQARSMLTRALAYTQSDQKGQAIALLKETDRFFNQVCMGAGGISETCYDLLDSPVTKPHESESDYTERGPVSYISDVIAVRMGDKAFDTPEGLQIPCKLVLMTPSQAATYLKNPGQFQSGLYADVDHSLYNISKGKVPIRMLAHDLNPVPAVSQAGLAPVDARCFRSAHDPKVSAVTGKGAVTMAIYTPGGLAPSTRNVKISAKRDFICAVIDGIAYVQRDERHDSAIARCNGPDTEIWATQLDATEHALKQSHRDMCELVHVQCNVSASPYPTHGDSNGVIGIKERYTACDISQLAKIGAEAAGVEYSDSHAVTLNRLRQFSAKDKTNLQIAMAKKTTELLERSERMSRLWTDEHPQDALPRVARIEPFQFKTTSDGIYKVDEFRCIGARDTCYAVNGRAVVLAKYNDPLNEHKVDCTVLFVDRTQGCDPDRRSVKLDSAGIIRNSSVRCALGQAHNDDLVIDSIYECPINGTCKINTVTGGRLDTNQWINLMVNWRESPNSPVQENLLHFCAANRLRTNEGVHKARIYTHETDNGLVSKFNTDWGIKLIK